MKTILNTSLRTAFACLLFLLWRGSNAQSVTLTLLQQPCNGNGIVVATVNGMNGPYTYHWSMNWMPVQSTSTSSATDTLFNYPGSNAYVIVSNGTQNINSTIIQAPPFTYTTSTTNAVCPGLGTASASISGGVPPYTVEWIEQSSNLVASNSNPASLPSGSYSILITDAAGCTYGSFAVQDSIFINNISPVNFNMFSTPANCANGTAYTSAPTGGLIPYSYSWSNGASSTSINNLSVGSYSVRVTDAQGCYNDGYVYVSQAITINVNATVTNATCLQSNGSITSFGSGGTSPYAFLYSNGQQTQTATNLSNGNYYITVTDANGCVGTGNAYVNSSSPITVTQSSNPSSCTNPTGSANLSISGGTPPYTVNWNTNPAQTGPALSSVPQGSYYFTVTDVNGCVRTGYVQILPVSQVSAYEVTSNPQCPQVNGTVSIQVLSGVPPFTYQWSNGATTSSISGVPAGAYYCTITDNLNCSITKSAYIQQSSTVNVNLGSTPSSCIYAADGTATALAYGGTPPYTYYWSNGQTSPTATGLLQGNYYVSVTDANGCSSYTYNHVAVGCSNSSTACYCTITGKVYEDVNSNCQYDFGEVGIHNIMVHCSPFGYAYTDASGDYSFQVPTGSYTLSESILVFYPLAPCQPYNVPVSVNAATGCTTTVDFANNSNPIHDMHVVTTNLTNMAPGNLLTQKVIFMNEGTFTESSIAASYKHDGQINYQQTAPSLFTQLAPAAEPNWYSITSGFPSLNPGTSQALSNSFLIPTNIPLGTVVNFLDTVVNNAPLSNWTNDYSPWNNVDAYQRTVVGSFDPNFKEVSPKGFGPQGYITANDSVLDYVVHFQNTGTYMAQKVVVMDTLDSDLDWTTLRPGYSNHTYVATVDENGVAKFTFNNINLPDSTSNPLGSIGYFVYSIKQKANLSSGTEIKNTAAIYFDYNAPVITNTTLNTINPAAGVKEIKQEDLSLALYPNPAASELNIRISSTDPKEKVSLRIISLTGQVLSSRNIQLQKGENLIHENIDGLSSGLYFVEVSDAKTRLITKLSVIR